MRSVSDMIVETKKPRKDHGAAVIAGFLLLVVTALGMPAAVVWMANSLASGSASYASLQ
jgi:hypothetical protein